MKLSGHNFANDVFNSLLDGISKDVELKKTAQQKSEPVFNDFFSSTTIDSLNGVRQEELQFIADGLSFAADNAKVAVSAEDLAKFASQAQREGLRGKKLERAAQKYCNHLDRDMASPRGTTHLSADDLINQLASHQVIPASHHPDHGSNNSVTGKYMGSSMNPNTIWDQDALQQKASVPLGDEKIKASKQAAADHRLAMKTAQWQELQDKHSDPVQVNKGITNAGTSESDVVTGQNMPANTMSIFSDNRNFENIPEKTMGEEIIAQAEARANKKANAESNDAQKPMNTRDSLNKLFS